MSKRLKASDTAYRSLKANKEENMTKYVGPIYAYVRKVEEIGRLR